MSKYNSLMKKAELYEKLALYGTRKDFLNAMAQGHSPTGVSPQDDAYLQELQMQSTPTQTVSETRITGPYKIDPELQDALNKVLDGKINPLLGDGILGHSTSLALKKFKEVFGKPATRTNILAELGKLNAPPAKEPGAPLPPMGGGLPSVAPSTRSSGIGEHAGTESGNFRPTT